MGWGSSTRRGGGRKVRALLRKVCLPCVSKRGMWDVPGILPGCPGPLGVFKKLVQKKVRAHFSLPSSGNTVAHRNITYKNLLCKCFILAGSNYNYTTHSRENSFLPVPLRSMVQKRHLQSHKYLLGELFCCQVTVSIT